MKYYKLHIFTEVHATGSDMKRRYAKTDIQTLTQSYIEETITNKQCEAKSDSW